MFSFTHLHLLEEKHTYFWDIITLQEINLEIKKGEFVAIIGGVGSGKSSLVKALGGNMNHID